MNKILLSLAIVLTVFGCKRSNYTDDLVSNQTKASIKTIEPLVLEPKPEVNEPAQAEPNAPAPATQVITLEQCRSLALENNLTLKAQLIAPTLAEESYNQERAKFEMAFTSSLNYYKGDSPSLSQLESNQQDQMTLGAGVQAPLVTGGTAALNLNDNRWHSDNPFINLDTSYSPRSSVSLSQPLLQGGGVKTARYSIRIAGLNQARVKAQTKLEVIAVVAAMDRVYWRLYAAQKALDVRQQQLDLAKAQLAQAIRQVNTGVSAQVEIVRAQAGVAQQAEAIIVAKNARADRQRELKRVLNKSGLTMQTRTKMIPETEPVPVAYALDPNTLLTSAFEHRMELLEFELQLLQDDQTIDYHKNLALPVATMNYTYNVRGLGETRKDAYDMLRERRYADHTMGLSMRIPLGNAAAKSRVRRAKYEKYQRLISRKQRKALVEYEVLSAMDQVQTNWQRIVASQQNTVLSSRVHDAERRQFEQGLRTSTDVLNAQTTLADAQLSELSALVEYQVALVDLAYATGTLLGAAQIEWEPIVPTIQ
ncbi:MAG: TolC family protein [Planctomycetes bacterium]|nr:TolC family protein [Planctomycetota bacterium]